MGRMTDSKPTQLKRLRLALNHHASDLLLVGDAFEEGGRYVQAEIPRTQSSQWTWLDWDNTYDRLAAEWRARFAQ